LTTLEMLRELEARGIRLVVRGDLLSLRGPENLLRQELTERLREHKPAILEAIRHQPACCECGALLLEPSTWWGGEPCHRDCGEAAWRREWLDLALDSVCAPLIELSQKHPCNT
jgi:TubC N-terminal docking domain